MIISGEELKEKVSKVVEELSKKQTYIKLQDAHDFAGTVCTWECDECRCNYKTEDVDICRMEEFLENLTKYQPTMGLIMRGEE